MRTITTWLCLLASACVAPVQQTAQLAPTTSRVAAPQLNVLFVLVDDYGWRDTGYNGSTFYETPNIDALSKRGVVFTQAYAACPVCSPTRASILTGKYPDRMATTDWFGAPQPETVQSHWTRDKPLLPAPYNEHLALEEVTLAEAFREAGYATFFAGKWHLGDSPEFWPEANGFAINKGGWTTGSPKGSGYFPPYANPRLADGPPGEELSDRLATETVTFIRDHKDKPFLAYLSFYSVHTPLMARPEVIAKYKQKRAALDVSHEMGEDIAGQKTRVVQSHAVYAAMIETMDAAVGKVLRALDEQGVADRTIVVFFSDNGGLSTAESSPTSNLPLRGGKGWLYEGGVREPCIIAAPGIAATTINTPIVSNDFYPTLLAMCGLPARLTQTLDGINVSPLLSGKPIRDRPLFWHYPHYGNQGSTPASAVRSGDWKLIRWYEPGRAAELFDLATDLGEQHDLAADQPAKVAELNSLLDAHLHSVNARLPTPNPRVHPATSVPAHADMDRR